MSYSVKEIYFTLHGEGVHAGSAAVFLRFTGCNLWTGLEEDRATAECSFCDTNFVGTDGPGGGKFATAGELAAAVERCWQAMSDDDRNRRVVCTGGEPLLQLDAQLIDSLHAAGFLVAVETNGTRAVPPGVDWICVSPKAQVPLVQTCGQELKLVYPQPGADPSQFEQLQFVHFCLQPMAGPQYEQNVKAAVAYCMAHPRWHLSLQLHKMLGIP